MNTPLNDTTQQKARELARQITVAHDLDPEIQEELYGHIEDKLLAYINGEETVSEEDALILAREHFGDASAIRGLLQEVHGEVAPAYLGRRLLALVITSFGIGVAVRVLRAILAPPLAMLGGSGAALGHPIVTLAIGFVTIYALYSLLKRWRDAGVSGSPPWYERWTVSRMLRWLCGVVVLSWAVPSLTFVSGSGLPGAAIVLPIAWLLCGCSLWLWWTDAAARPLPANLGLGLLWVAYTFISTLYPAKVYCMLGDGPLESGATYILQGHFGDTPFTGYLAYFGSWQSISDVTNSLLVYSAVAFICCVAAAAWRLHGRRSREHANTPHIQA